MNDLQTQGKIDLEKNIESFQENPEKTNITKESLRRNYRCSRFKEYKDNVFFTHYFYRIPKEEDLIMILQVFTFNRCAFSFDVKNYGFPEDFKIEYKPEKMNMDLSERCRKKYEEILNKNNLPINFLLEEIGSSINDAIKFKVLLEEMLVSKKDREKERARIEKDIEEIIRKHNYQPIGDETMEGDCTFAGNNIRRMLHSLNIEERIKYVDCGTLIQTTKELSHDTTFIFDTESNFWAVINSKSPRIKYNLVPKEEIKNMGNRYSDNDKNMKVDIKKLMTIK